MKKTLSVVVPCYKCGSFIRNNITKLREDLQSIQKNNFSDFEIVTVIDGRIDNAEEELKGLEKVKVHAYDVNQGKGHALKQGFYQSSGEIITFIDADRDFNPKQIANFFPYVAAADLVVGSKRHPFSNVKYPLFRHILSMGYQLLSKIFLGISLRDTQSGLKVMRRELLEVLMPLIQVRRFAFDLEMCFLAEKHGFRVVEAPVSIDFKGGTSTIGVVTPFRMFLDLLAIRYRYSFKRFYQKKYAETFFKP